MAIENNTDYTLKGSQVLALRDYVNAAMNLPGTVIGSGAPTTATEGNVGQFYYDTVNDKFYYCEAKTAQGTTPETYLYTWTLQVSGPTVVQTTGTSTTDVMSQNAVSSMVFNDPDTNLDVRIGDGASVIHRSGWSYRQVAIGDRARILSGGKNIAIGQTVTVEGTSDGSIAIGGSARSDRGICIGGSLNSNCTGAIAIGYGANVGGVSGYYPTYSIALGYNARPSRSGEVNIGSGTLSYGYNSTSYRVLGGVHDPVDAHDAATKGYVDGLVGNVAATLNVINNGGNS